jgi:hypothetical protein
MTLPFVTTKNINLLILTTYIIAPAPLSMLIISGGALIPSAINKAVCPPILLELTSGIDWMNL